MGRMIPYIIYIMENTKCLKPPTRSIISTLPEVFRSHKQLLHLPNLPGNKRASNHGSTHKNHLTRGTLMVTCGDGPASAGQNGISGRRVEEITTFKEVSCFRGSCSLLSFFKKLSRKMTGWWF